MTRILITGSRTWTNEAAVIEAITQAIGLDGRNVIVHGGCPTGADAIAQRTAEAVGIPTEVHYADWERHGRKAGPLRNREMVKLGASVCLAFLDRCTQPQCRTPRPHPSHGAGLTANLAEQAGISTRRYYA